MRIVLLTQDDPFYLGRHLDFLLQNMPPHSEVVGCVVFSVSPFGKKESFLQKVRKTIDIFGFGFFVRYGSKYVQAKLSRSFALRSVLGRFNIPEIQIFGSINSQSSLESIQAYKPDLLISIAGNQIFRQELINLAPLGCLNLHTALLPKYRGLMPSFWVLRHNESKTGVSVFYVDEGIDSGPILVQKEVDIGTMSQQQLIERTKKLGMTAILEAIEKIHSGNTETIANADNDSSYYSFPTREDVKAFLAAGKKFY